MASVDSDTGTASTARPTTPGRHLHYQRHAVLLPTATAAADYTIDREAEVCLSVCLSDGGVGGGFLSVMGLLQLRYEHDSSTIRLRFERDTTSYEELCAFEQ